MGSITECLGVKGDRDKVEQCSSIVAKVGLDEKCCFVEEM